MPMPMPILAGEAAADRVTVMGKNTRGTAALVRARQVQPCFGLLFYCAGFVVRVLL